MKRIRSAIYVGGQHFVIRPYKPSDEVFINRIFEYFKSLVINIEDKPKQGIENESSKS